MPPCCKLDFCEFVSSWAGQDCPCRHEFDDEVKSSSILPDEVQGNIGHAAEELGRLAIRDQNCNGDNCERISRRGSRVPLPWELIQPTLRILGHCLLAPLIPQEVRDAASSAVCCVYARASHDIEPQVILAARSLIQLDISTRKTAKDALIFSAPDQASNHI
ncbi:hypothetical protein AXF42_Ash013562 [Apostasia shenzhenica]|uniref:Uncharacterized protein n=1 Tax=Apostasia shenzhenica TaxID=1088818 RepID=A0A2I0APC1_9ASPA|nr:hypothetical protein AXF42_Ash013562 [Apostasia shenzhenica]